MELQHLRGSWTAAILVLTVWWPLFSQITPVNNKWSIIIDHLAVSELDSKIIRFWHFFYSSYFPYGGQHGFRSTIFEVSLYLIIDRTSDSYFYFCPAIFEVPTDTCFIQIIYAPTSSLLQGKYLLFSPSPLCLNIFRLFVILSLTQLYRYTPEIFLFSTATFKYTPSDELDMNIQRTSFGLLFSHWNGYNHFRIKRR
jgi:hypothetical protein